MQLYVDNDCVYDLRILNDFVILRYILYEKRFSKTGIINFNKNNFTAKVSTHKGDVCVCVRGVVLVVATVDPEAKNEN